MNPPEAAAALAALAERYWRFECEETPLAAALAGQPLPDAVLFRESEADHERRDRRAGELLAELGAIPITQLTAQQRATGKLLERDLTAVRNHFRVRAHRRPSLFPAGPDFTATFWAHSTNLADAESAARYVDRLAGLPAYLNDVRANIAAGLDEGMRYPRAVLDCAAANTRAMLTGDAEASAWLGPFRRSPAAEQPAVRAQRERALGVVRDALVPALQAHAAFMEGPVRRAARDTLACTDDPDGREFYRVLAHHFTTTDLTPEAIHALGLAEVARLDAEIEQVAAQAGFAGDVAGYRRFLATDAQFVAASGDALRSAMESLCKRIDRRIPAYFGRIPRITYGVESMPEAVSAKMPPAYAQPSPADGTAAGVFWVSGLPAKCPSYMHVPIAVHEAWPGHLMHIALMQEDDDLPMFRRLGAVKYTACVEGWALYCEGLAVEMGLYDTPHQHYGRLEMELWRALRLVVDTGIHWYGWSRDRAIACMAERLTHSRETIEGEVDRYAALPGQALGYQIGNLRVRALRQRCEAALAQSFTHRSFHAAVMGAGAVTLPVLDDLVEDWLQSQLARADGNGTPDPAATARA